MGEIKNNWQSQCLDWLASVPSTFFVPRNIEAEDDYICFYLKGFSNHIRFEVTENESNMWLDFEETMDWFPIGFFSPQKQGEHYVCECCDELTRPIFDSWAQAYQELVIQPIEEKIETYVRDAKFMHYKVTPGFAYAYLSALEDPNENDENSLSIVDTSGC